MLDAHLMSNMVPGLADCKYGQQGTEDHIADAKKERHRSKPVVLGEPSSRESASGHSNIARKLVESHREAPLLRAYEVDLHDHGGGPGESLADTEQHIGCDYPGPLGRPHQHERDRDGDQPSGDQHVSTPESVGQAP